MPETIEEAREFLEKLELAAYTQGALDECFLDPGQVGDAKALYRHFLLMVWYRDHTNASGTLIPTPLCDYVWHQHILHTKEYREFCDQFFGKYLDHIPGFGDGKADHDKAVAFTKRISAALGEHSFVDETQTDKTVFSREDQIRAAEAAVDEIYVGGWG